MYGTGVRAQVFEVIVRQAISGAPWREICAGPMAVNKITEEEVQSEADRRLNLFQKSMSERERALLAEHLDQWKERLSPPGTSLVFDREVGQSVDIAALLAEFYDAHGMPPPK